MKNTSDEKETRDAFAGSQAHGKVLLRFRVTLLVARIGDASRQPAVSLLLAPTRALAPRDARACPSQSQVRARLMIIVHEVSEVAKQAGFAEYDHVIQALAADRADHPLDIRSLLRYARRAQHFPNPHILQLVRELTAENPVAVAQ